ncbi:MAG: serine hydrolase domain-containing protein [Candidatus Sulfotelmatobacter sp.]
MKSLAKRRMLGSAVLVCLIAVSISGGAVLHGQTVQDPDRPLTRASVIKYLKEQIQKRMDASKIPGLAIALVDGDKVAWSEGFGYTERGGSQTVTPDTLFSMQSISKHYTALGFLRAVDKSMLQLDEPLTQELPTFKVHSRLGEGEVRKITFRQLLTKPLVRPSARSACWE